MQALLSSAAGRRELEAWPQYSRHIMGPELDATRRPQVSLDVFTYYMFWTAFYVLRGNRWGTLQRAEKRPAVCAC
jgi:hypothetical protein